METSSPATTDPPPPLALAGTSIPVAVSQCSAPSPAPARPPASSGTWPYSRLGFNYASPIATGWALESASRGPHIMSNIFVAKALLDYATAEAGCDPLAAVPCSRRVHGFLPSSLLTNMVLVSGLLCAAIMPLVGSIVDHTPYRRALGRASWAGIMAVHATLLFANPSNWLSMAGVQVFGRVVDLTHLIITYAYLPEITDDPTELSRLSSSFNVKQYVTSALFLGSVGAAAAALKLGSGGTVVLSQSVVLVVTFLLMGAAWATDLFPPRPALSAVPPGSRLVCAGFRRLWRTILKIFTTYRPLRWMIVTLVLAEAASNTFTQVAITYTSQVLGMDGTDVSAMIFVLLLATVPGSAFMAYFSEKTDPAWSYQASLAFFGTVTIAASMLLHGPDDVGLCYLFAVAWGFGFGWMHPAGRTLYATIIPVGQETEMMGIYTFSGQVLLFAPPLLFSYLNEAGYPMSFGLGSLGMFFFAAAMCAGAMGSFEEAQVAVGRGKASVEGVEVEGGEARE